MGWFIGLLLLGGICAVLYFDNVEQEKNNEDE